jgi:hypothetical protein
VTARWNELASEWDDHRRRPVVLAAEYRVSWSAVVSHAYTLGLIDHGEHEVLRARRPVAGDYVEVGIGFVEELIPVSLHRTLTREDLPQPTEVPIESLTREFEELD